MTISFIIAYILISTFIFIVLAGIYQFIFITEYESFIDKEFIKFALYNLFFNCVNLLILFLYIRTVILIRKSLYKKGDIVYVYGVSDKYKIIGYLIELDRIKTYVVENILTNKKGTVDVNSVCDVYIETDDYDKYLELKNKHEKRKQNIKNILE